MAFFASRDRDPEPEPQAPTFTALTPAQMWEAWDSCFPNFFDQGGVYVGESYHGTDIDNVTSLEERWRRGVLAAWAYADTSRSNPKAFEQPRAIKDRDDLVRLIQKIFLGLIRHTNIHEVLPIEEINAVEDRMKALEIPPEPEKVL